MLYLVQLYKKQKILTVYTVPYIPVQVQVHAQIFNIAILDPASMFNEWHIYRTLYNNIFV